MRICEISWRMTSWYYTVFKHWPHYTGSLHATVKVWCVYWTSSSINFCGSHQHSFRPPRVQNHPAPHHTHPTTAQIISYSAMYSRLLFRYVPLSHLQFTAGMYTIVSVSYPPCYVPLLLSTSWCANSPCYYATPTTARQQFYELSYDPTSNHLLSGRTCHTSRCVEEWLPAIPRRPKM
jgi:hypothetical protein